MEKNRKRISEIGAHGDENNRLKRFIEKLKTFRASRSAGPLGRHRELPPEAEPNITTRRLFLGSTLEFLQREYFSEPKPKKTRGMTFEP